MKVRSALLKVVLSLVLVCAAIGTFLFWSADPLQLIAPTDQNLASIFQSRRADFERLRQMVLEEGQAKLYFSISTLDGISPESRKREFERLLRLKVGGLVVAVNHNDDNVRFIFASGGLLAIGPGWVKGIQWYSQGPMLDRVKAHSLDNDRRASADGYARELAPGWFIFYEKDD